ncbi:MAG TPA: desaturase [Myxococcaceae bacterium]|nr:desaturase [Myxococcaceae bacterium]
MVRSAASRRQVLTAPSRHVYDVIVVGGQLGGALGAALLAKRGYQVLYVEHEATERPYTHDGWTLPIAPFLLPTLRSMPGVGTALAELGLQQSLPRLNQPRDPALQLILEDARVDLWEDPARRRRELERAFGAETAEALHARLEQLATQHQTSDAFFTEPRPLPPESWLERMQLKRMVTPGLETPPALSEASGSERLLSALADFAGYLDEGGAGPLSRTRLLSQLGRGGMQLPGGRSGLREQLTRRTAELGGDVLIQASDGSPVLVESLAFDGNRLEGITLLHNDQVYRADMVLAAMDGASLRRLLPEKKRHRKLAQELDTSRVRSFLLTVNWVLPERALPRGLSSLALAAAESSGDRPLLIEVLPAQRIEGGGDPGSCVVSASTRVPANVLELGEAHLGEWIARVEARLDWLMPFSRDHLLARSVPILDAPQLRTGLLPHPHFSFEEPPILGVAGVRQRTGTKQLLLASREILPGLGVEGELLSGVRAARLVQERLKREPSLRRG